MTTPRHTINWSHKSVKRFAHKADPVQTMVARARDIVLDARDKGWSGPPFDLTALATILKIDVQPSQSVVDARTVPTGDRFVIEFNPDQPRGRQRYSIAHEIAHTFFPDAHEAVRNRLSKREMQADDWQLELLCNIGAAEILMPLGGDSDLGQEAPSIDGILEQRKKFAVSTEAMAMRIVRLTDQPCAVFAASSVNDDPEKYRVDYAIGSRAWGQESLNGMALPSQSVVHQCTAIGYTAKGKEKWSFSRSDVSVECVGVPPYPEHRLPRVVGIVRLREASHPTVNRISYLKGDATQPRGPGTRIIAHVVNDKTPNWGGGFARAVKARWPDVQSDFIRWVEGDKSNLTLGNSRSMWPDASIGVFSMVCQRGYGESATPRIRYAALAKALEALGGAASDRGASVHMPTIGCGEAGGNWRIVSELIDECLCQRDVPVTVYQLPNQPDIRKKAEHSLFSQGAT